MELTTRERAALLHLRGQCLVNGVPPTLRELGTLLEVSLTRAHQLVDSLVWKGWVARRVSRGSRALTFLDPPPPAGP